MSALRRQAPAAPLALEARVSNPDPEALTVTIDQFDGDALARHAWEVASWPRSGGALPARGDRCLVVMSETGRPWVVAGDWSGPPAWRPLPLTGDWSTWGDGNFPHGFTRAPNGWVSLRGLVMHARVPQAYGDMLARPLPEGFRPATNRTFPASVNGYPTRMQVYPSGRLINCEVPAGLPNRAWWTLDSVGYWAER